MDRILIVDDDALILQALSRILRQEGYEVISHQDPLKAAEERDFVVVLSDFMMPHLNGLELLERFRESVPRAMRMMLTAASDFRVASDAVNRAEVFRLLGKPWNLPELTGAVRQAVEHYKLIEENERLNKVVSERNSELTQLNAHLEKLVVERTNGLLDGMISALDYRDTETQWHSRRVALYTRRLAEQVGVRDGDLEMIEQGALLHDIGKIGVSDTILLKPGKLTPEEWVEMRKHPEFGWQMLARIPYLSEASLIVLQHQERFDGKGYPAGLQGEQIVLGARLFAVADTFDAITSDRPYRAGRSYEVARDEIVRCGGTQFDPAVVKAFLEIDASEWKQIRHSVEKLEATMPRPSPTTASPTTSTPASTPTSVARAG